MKNEKKSGAETSLRFAAALAAVLLSAGMLAGCTGNGEGEGKNENITTASDPVAETAADTEAETTAEEPVKPVDFSEIEAKFDPDAIYDTIGENGYVVFGEESQYMLTSLSNFSEKLLERLDIDPRGYTLAVSAEEFSSFQADYAYVEYGSYMEKQLKMRVECIETGERTEACRIKFRMLRYSDLSFYVDPYDYTPVFGKECDERMIAASLYREGNIARLAAALKKAENGEKVTVAYLGGSITEGAGSLTRPHCWAKLTANGLSLAYPDAEIEYVNSGIGGTPSELGAIRLEPDVLDYEPDIVFVEFAVNDGGSVVRESFESIVRRVLESEKNPAVVIVVSASSGGLDAGPGKAMKTFAEYYDLPLIDVNNAVWEEINAESFAFGSLCSDDTHPNQWGHYLMGRMMLHFFDAVREKAAGASEEELTVRPLDVPPTQELFSYGIIWDDAADSTVSAGSCWKAGTEENIRFQNGWTFSGEGSGEDAVLSLTFEGSHLWLTTGGQGTVSVSIDGGEAVSVTADRGTDAEFRDAILLDEGSHTVTVTGTAGESDGFCLLGFGHN